MEEEFLGALFKGGELLASGKITEALEHLEKAHGLAPKNEKAQNLLGLAYFKLGRLDDLARRQQLATLVERSEKLFLDGWISSPRTGGHRFPLSDWR